MLLVHYRIPPFQDRLQPLKRCKIVEYGQFEFQLDSIGDVMFERICRFKKSDIPRLIDLFDLHNVRYPHRLNPSPELAITVLLNNLSFPRTYFEQTLRFGRSQAYICVVFNTLIRYLYRRYEGMMKWHPKLDYNRAKRAFCKPEKLQGIYYTGYKHAHGCKFQGIVCPDGLMMSLSGPYEGRLNDLNMVLESRVAEVINEKFEPYEPPDQLNKMLFLYGDKAYHGLPRIIAPYPRNNLIGEETHKWNKEMERARVAVENAFGQTHCLWMMNAFSKNLRSGSSPLRASHERLHLSLWVWDCGKVSYEAIKSR
ncbi:hypothetical protein Egran_06676 [Elaphomyces granulatus]|uniref:DDE Tnp4 domain-containing protein n=1 Tax=Elaphomyces granulatus TaxID=519963 RepID=A0A232LN36_9EURO|nr:hypothetical protein Egran_06676 [Elaphomyces granulatus]